jgi:hypothetical protein
MATPSDNSSALGLLYSLSASQKNMLAGGIGGCVGKTVTAPLSRITILFQVNSLPPREFVAGSSSSSGGVRATRSMYSVMLQLAKQEGVTSLWKGNFTAVIHRFPYSAINFASYEYLKKAASGIGREHESIPIALQLLSNRFPIAFQSLYNRFVIALQSLCNRFVITLQSHCNRNHIPIVLQSHSRRFTIAFQSHPNCIPIVL